MQAMVQEAESEGEEARAFLADAARHDPAPGSDNNGVAAGEWDRGQTGLPPDCPVIPLGVDNHTYYFLDTLGQMRALEFGQFGQKAVGSLFMGRPNYLYWAWPRKDKDGAVVSWRQEKATEDLMGACARKGPWNAVERARGRGAWKLDDGALAFHSGTRLFIRGRRDNLGELEGNVYMTRPPILTPYPVNMEAGRGPAMKLLALLKSWCWVRPDIDALLLLGWIAASLIGGALPWRPVVYMTGDKACGKSTLQRVIKSLLGNALIQSSDTTAAGIYQLLKSDALPVAVDELEGKADTRRAKAILELARIAASGDLMLRGGDSHQGTQFNARSCFIFSSINTPPLEPQDLSRMALLRLRRLPKGTVPPDIQEKEMHQLGRQILRRMVDGWDSFPATWRRYREMLSAAGHDSRGQDTFGTLLACADILIGADAEALGVPMAGGDDPEHSAHWQKAFAAEQMGELEDAEENWRLCLNAILSTQVDGWRHGTHLTVGSVLEDYRSRDGEVTYDKARKMLEQVGLGLQRPGEGEQEGSVFVPNQHPGLFNLLRETKWRGEPGAGVWSGALRQAPQDSYRECQGRVTGVKGRGTAFPLSVVLAVAANPPVPVPQAQAQPDDPGDYEFPA